MLYLCEEDSNTDDDLSTFDPVSQGPKRQGHWEGECDTLSWDSETQMAAYVVMSVMGMGPPYPQDQYVLFHLSALWKY